MRRPLVIYDLELIPSDSSDRTQILFSFLSVEHLNVLFFFLVCLNVNVKAVKVCLGSSESLNFRRDVVVSASKPFQRFLGLLIKQYRHRLNMALDLQSLFRLLRSVILIGETPQRPQPPPPSPAFWLIYEGAIGQTR